MLTFDRLREVNTARCEEVFHPVDDWSLCDWACALAGEAGEVCNVVKKHRRDNLPDQEVKAQLAAELASVVMYADLFAARLGISLGQAVVHKFNEVSRRRGSGHLLHE